MAWIGPIKHWKHRVNLYLFFLSCRREETIRAIDEDIHRERQAADEVVQAMPAAKQEKYFTTMAANEELLQVVDLGAPLFSAGSRASA